METCEIWLESDVEMPATDEFVVEIAVEVAADSTPSTDDRPATDELVVEIAADVTADSLEVVVERLLMPELIDETAVETDATSAERVADNCETWLEIDVESELIWLDCEVDRLTSALFAAEMAVELTTDMLETSEDRPVSDVATELTAPCTPPIWL